MDTVARWWLVFLVACAQPAATPSPSRPDGGGLVFEALDLGPHRDAGGRDFDYANYQMADLAGGPGAADLAAARDLAGPPLDLAGVTDLAHCTTVENCFNDIDDDCNGKINDGCPNTVTVGTPVPLAAYGSSTLGDPQSAFCPAGAIATGVRFHVDDFDSVMAGAGVFCATPTLVRGASSYSIALTAIPGPSADFAGLYEDGSFDTSCAAGAFQPVWGGRVNTDGSYVYGLGMDCADGTLSLSATNKLTISFTPKNAPLGQDYARGSEYTPNCPNGSALVGYKGRAGNVLDQIQPVCAPLVVTYK
jgi:hypothetical protein